MRVVRADAMGMCFGVRDALAALEGLDEPARATIHGELVHNEAVLGALRDRGFAMSDESGRRDLPPTDVVVITAHGVSDRERDRLESAGKHLVDTTCPLVRRAHLAARSLSARGYHVLVVGRPGHVEVRGIVEDLPAYDLVPDESAARRFEADRLGVVFQTTTAPRRAGAILGAIRRANPHAEVRAVDTVCRPTKLRQRAVERLISETDAVVVVGGRNSNNARELLELCRERGRPAWLVRDRSELDAAWFDGVRTVGLTAGTSTPDALIDGVERALAAINPVPAP